MGVGRFVFTPILPLMQHQAGLSAAAGAHLATANYVGYLAGALIGTLAPALIRSRAVLRGTLLLMTATLAGMPATHSATAWLALRLVAGIASAVVFVAVADSLLTGLGRHAGRVMGWSLGGVGAGIALSGLLVLALRPIGDWRAAWWSAAALSLVFTLAAWNLPAGGTSAARPGGTGERAGSPAGGAPRRLGSAGRPLPHRWFAALMVAYTLEGVGYIIAGTFLVAAIEQGSPTWVGSGAWVLVGIAAVPSASLWTGLGRRWSLPALLLGALAVQAVGIALPALVDGTAAALVSAVLFGGTFLGVSTLSLGTGAHLGFPRSVALLTAGYSVGQIAGPLAAGPLLHHGYRPALLLASAVLLAAVAAAAFLRVAFPHTAQPVR